MKDSFSIAIAMFAATTPALAGGIPSGTTIYINRTGFNVAAAPLMIEDFESEALGDLTPPETLDSGLTVGLTSGTVSSYISTAGLFGFFNTIGESNVLAFGRIGDSGASETGSYTASFSFGTAVNAFGFDLSGFEPDVGAGGFNITTLNNGQIVDDYFLPVNTPFGPPQFYGFISENAFDEFRVNIPVLDVGGLADFVAFDGVAWGIPTPSALSVLALAACVTTRRRR